MTRSAFILAIFALLLTTTGCLEQYDKDYRYRTMTEKQDNLDQDYLNNYYYDSENWTDQNLWDQNNQNNPQQAGSAASQNGAGSGLGSQGASSQNGAGSASGSQGGSSQNGAGSASGSQGGSSQNGAGSASGSQGGSSQNGAGSASGSQGGSSSSQLGATCDTDPNVGYCEDNKAYRCDGTLVEDCGKKSQMCGLNADYQYGCLNHCRNQFHYCQGNLICANVGGYYSDSGVDCYDPCGRVTAMGQCDGDILSYCRLSDDSTNGYADGTKSILWVEDCSEKGQTCGVDSRGNHKCVKK